MSWQDRLERVTHPDGRRLIGASFRGVAFFVSSSERSGGRRTVKHEFPGRDDPHVEDLGRVSRTFPIDGYVLGPDYITQRDALISACEDTSGPGELVHPYFGKKRVICTALSVRESSGDGGIAQFGLTFDEAPDKASIPVDATDFVEKVRASGAAAQKGTADEFAALYQAESVPGFALDSAIETVTDFTESLERASAPALKTQDELAQMALKVETLTDSIGTLARQPAEILAAYVECVTILADSTGDALDVLGALIQAYETPAVQPVPETTDTRIQEAANLRALTAALKTTLAIQQVIAATRADYESVDQALATRDAVTVRLDEQIELAGDVAFPGLLALRADFLAAVPSETTHARILQIERRVATPSIMIAYRLYGNVDKELDVVARNHARRPAFMAGTLQVLSDE